MSGHAEGRAFTQLAAEPSLAARASREQVWDLCRLASVGTYRTLRQQYRLVGKART